MPLEEALERILGGARPTGATDELSLIDALGAVLAEDVISGIDVPGDDNSAMDGYAVRGEDLPGPLPISQRIAAGAVGEPLQPGTAARIFTGAPIPAGADAVVMQENCSVDQGGLLSVEGTVTTAQNIRPRGQDIAAGAVALSKGRRLRPQDLGLLASVGVARVTVFRRLKVAVLSTGDELVEPGTAGLAGGQLYNSNRFTIAGLLARLGLEFVDVGIIPDDAQATAKALLRASELADCVITSGGVSVGEEDHVKAQVEQIGHIDLWKLAIKPGKPLAFGAIGDTPFIGLPGNPTSVFATFCLVARPFLLKLQGATDCRIPELTVTAGFATAKSSPRQDHVRVSLESGDEGLVARRFANQSSGVLSSVSQSDALAVVPPGVVVSEGDKVQVLLLDLLA